MNAKRVLKNSPAGGVSPSRIARTMLAYSRICVTGLVISESNQFSTVTLWETPSPRTMRPPDCSSMVAAVCAVETGVREKMGSTPVPSRTRSVTAAYAERTASESRWAMWVV